MPAPLTIAARRAMVEQLMRQEPGISARTIAARLGVGKDTIRRDIAEIEEEQRQRAPQPPSTQPGAAPSSDALLLVLDESMRQALAVLRATRGAPDTQEQNVAAARAAIRAMADTVIELRHQAQERSRP
ncbi:helix-turn-helix domain-containing protein [Streptomyces sp. NPDC014802]|uniref:helix-turn-helix domain-containing protein n=1 Tax=Streptomyces sp. NPDC014802 TaxID=3364917 RepID=UPI0036FB4087